MRISRNKRPSKVVTIIGVIVIVFVGSCVAQWWGDQSVVGTWQLRSSYTGSIDPTATTITLEFRPDGTGTKIITGMQPTQSRFAYSVIGNWFSIRTTDDTLDGVTTHYTYQDSLHMLSGLNDSGGIAVAGNTLTLYTSYPPEGDGEEYDRISK